MENNQATVPHHFVETMLTMAAEQGCDTNKLLRNIGINPVDIAAKKPVSILRYGELYHHIIELIQDEWFGLLNGSPVPKGTIRQLLYLIVHCKTLAQALTRSSEFFEICRGFKVKQQFSIEGDYATIKVARLDCVQPQAFDALIADTDSATIKATLSAWHGFNSWLIGQYVPLTDIYYSFSDDSQPAKKLSGKPGYHYGH